MKLNSISLDLPASLNVATTSSFTGNMTTSNIATTGSITVTGNISTAGNVIAANLYSKTAVQTLITINIKSWDDASGQINSNAATLGNYIAWNTQGLGIPTVTTRSSGTKLVLYPAMSNVQVDYAIGIEQDNMWFSTPTTSTWYKWYCGTTQVLSVTASGIVSNKPIYRYQAATAAVGNET